MTQDEAMLTLKGLIDSGAAPSFVLLVRKEDGSVDVRTDVSFEEYTAMGRVPDCDCQLIQCVCAQARQHAKECRYRVALTCAIPITCEAHHEDVCSVCDPCTCILIANGIDVKDFK